MIRHVVKEVNPDGIGHEKRLRALQPAVVKELKAAIKRDGLLQPIVVTPRPPGTGRAYRLIAGLHRLTAVRELKLPAIPCMIVEGADAEQQELLEIRENLLRAPLTEIERVAHRQRERELLAAAGGFAERVPQNPLGGRPTGGNRAAARALGVSEKTVRNDAKIAALPEEVKEAARVGRLGVRDLLDVASAPKEQQLAVAQAKASEPSTRPAAPPKPHQPQAASTPRAAPPVAEMATVRAWVASYGWSGVREIVQAVWREQHPEGRVVLNTSNGPKAG